MTHATTALFSTWTEATDAIRVLEVRGVDASGVSILMSEAFAEDFRQEARLREPGGWGPLGWGRGVDDGEVVGALRSLASGLRRVGAASSGGARVVAAGPVAGELPGASGRCPAEVVVEAMVRFGVGYRLAVLFATTYEDGKVLVAVQCGDGSWQEGADDILRDAGGVQIAQGAMSTR